MSSDITFIPAAPEDYADLSMFLSFEYFVHRHLDWRPSLAWLGQHPFWLAKVKNEIIACFAAVPEPQQYAWVRLFACSAVYSKTALWQEFLQKSLHQFSPQVKTIGALGMEKWFVKLLDQSDFKLFQRIIVLEWIKKKISGLPVPNGFQLRKMTEHDFAEVFLLDQKCFSPAWQLSLSAMENAFNQAGYATVMEQDNHIVAYQITTEALSSAHLARIAVDPALQGKRLGKFILNDLLYYYTHYGIERFTVNTQNDNFKSQALYHQAGFVETDENYAVYEYQIK
jgi:ribosomal-protein-alanine N-acetyltransferase